MRIKAIILIAATFAVLSIAACSSEPTATSSADNKNAKPAESGPRKALKKFYEVIGTDRPSYGAEAGEDTELQAVITRDSYQFQQAVMREAKMNENAVRIAAKLWAQGLGLGTPEAPSEVVSENSGQSPATIDVKSASTGQISRIVFVTEDGEWKLDMVATNKGRSAK